MVTIDDFKKFDIRIAEIKDVREHPHADRLYLIDVEIDGQTRQIIGGIRDYYKADELIGKKIVVIANLEPATIRGEVSNGMLLAAKDDNSLAILVPDRGIEVSSKIS